MSNLPSSKQSALYRVDWSRYHTWSLVLPPNRPSSNLLNIIRSVISSAIKIGKVCVLGSTPEFRTLCNSPKIDSVDVIDCSSDFYNMSSAMCIPNPNEKHIQGDWIEVLSESRLKYDLVLSHLTHGNVPFANRNNFYKAISDSLTDRGHFIDYVFQPKAPGYSIKDIKEIFSNKPANLRTYNDFNSIALFQSNQIANLGCVDTTEIYRYLENEIDNKKLRLILNETKIITPEGNRWDYSFETSPTSLGYNKHLKEVRVFEEDEYYSFANVASLIISESNNG